jgi:predicted transcriptional regulator
MPSATSIKLPDDLKERIAAVVEGTDDTAHAFMLKAIRKATEEAEWMRSFVAEAKAAQAEMERTGMGYRYEDVKAYWLAKAEGKKPAAPKLKRIA